MDLRNVPPREGAESNDQQGGAGNKASKTKDLTGTKANGEWEDWVISEQKVPIEKDTPKPAQANVPGADPDPTAGKSPGKPAPGTEAIIPATKPTPPSTSKMDQTAKNPNPSVAVTKPTPPPTSKLGETAKDPIPDPPKAKPVPVKTNQQAKDAASLPTQAPKPETVPPKAVSPRPEGADPSTGLKDKSKPGIVVSAPPKKVVVVVPPALPVPTKTSAKTLAQAQIPEPVGVRAPLSEKKFEELQSGLSVDSPILPPSAKGLADRDKRELDELELMMKDAGDLVPEQNKASSAHHSGLPDCPEVAPVGGMSHPSIVSPEFATLFFPHVETFIRLPEVRKFLSNPTTIDFLREKGCPPPSDSEANESKRDITVKRKIISSVPVPRKSDSNQKTDGGIPGDATPHHPAKDDLMSPESVPLPAMSRHRSKASKTTKLKADGMLMKSHITTYVPICLYLAKILLREDDIKTFTRLYKLMNPDNPGFESSSVHSDRLYLQHLMRTIVFLDEGALFDYWVAHLPDQVQLVDMCYFDIFSDLNRYDYQLRFFEAFKGFLERTAIRKSLSLKNMNQAPGKLNQVIQDPAQSAQLVELITRDKVVVLVKNYFECTIENQLLMSILRLLDIDDKAILTVLLDTKEEDRIIKVVREVGLMDHLDMRDLVNRGLFKTLILFDKNELINVFNLPVKADNPRYNVYAELCKRVRKGIDVESLCNVIIYVSETFWDHEKLVKFYEALSRLLRSMPKDNDEPSWLVYLKNPPLFFITLIYFFSQAKQQLDYKDPEIIELNKDMLNFCISYIHNASDENLKMNLFDKDGKDMEFLNYVMLVKEMRILEISTIENLLNEMWDINRSSMQTLDTFMRVDFMRSTFTKFSLSVFTRHYETPIESGDNFQMEFCFVTNSVLMKVLSEIVWPCLMIIMDFVFSMRIISEYQSRNHLPSKTWLRDYYSAAPVFSLVHIFLRTSQIVSFFIKALAIRSFNRGGHTLLGFYKLLLFLYFVQMGVWPLFFIRYFNFFSVVQMMITVLQVFYVLYKTLSLNEIGVIIRIFGRMSVVVIVFGTVSFSIITVIAYTIYTVFTEFTQRAEGQIYTDFNLFSDLYQGIMTLYEFVFGAVVLVRPYLEQSLYTYSMTLVMTLFSFFGNIMLANMLVAFLTSQFDLISTNAKYLTMNMQYELIQIYNMKDLDSIFTVPFFLAIPALPFYFCMWRQGGARKSVNRFLRKVTHVVSFFIPTFLFMAFKLLLLLLWRYLEISVHLLLHVPVAPVNALYLPLWLLGGPFLLLKLYILDLATLCRIMLDFKKDGFDLLNFDLEEDARANVVSIFVQMKRVMNRLILIGRDTVQLKEFLQFLGILNIADNMASKVAGEETDFNALGHLGIAGLLGQVLGAGQEPETKEDPSQEAIEDYPGSAESNPFNRKYRQPSRILAPILATKFADGGPELGNMTLDLRFMQEKFRNNVTTENIHRLLSFDKHALMKASLHISINEEDQELRQEVSELSKLSLSSFKKMDFVHKEIARLRQLVRQ